MLIKKSPSPYPLSLPFLLLLLPQLSVLLKHRKKSYLYSNSHNTSTPKKKKTVKDDINSSE